MKKKVIASLLTVCMLFTLLPTAAFAEEEQTGTQAPVESVEPTAAPSVEPTQEAEVTPTEAPSAEPTPTPEATETPEPTVEPTTAPSEEPVVVPVKKAAARTVAEEEQTEAQKLQAAIDAAVDGEETTVTMTADIENMTTAEIINIPAGKNIVLDMAGHKITVADNFNGRVIANKGTLTVTGEGTIDARVSNNGYGAIRNDDGGDLTIENGTYYGNEHANGAVIRNGLNSTLTIKDGMFEGTGAVYNEGAMATIYKGTFHTLSCTGCISSAWNYAFNNTNGGKMKILAENDEDVKAYGSQGALAAAQGTEVYVKGGTFWTEVCSNNHTYNAFYALYVSGTADRTATCIIDGGKFYTTADISCVYVENNNPSDNGGDPGKAIVRINGGSFEQGPAGQLIKFENKNDSVIAIAGGTFTGAENELAEVATYVDPAYILDASGKVEPLTAENAVAQVGDKFYSSLQAAIDAAGSGDTVTLLKSTSVDRANEVYGVKVWNDCDITLNLNGKTLDGAIWNYGTLTITGNGTVNNTGNENGWPAVENWHSNAKLTIENGTFVASSDNALLNSNGAEATINGGTYSGGFGSVLNNNGGVMTINNGEFQSCVRNGLSDDEYESTMTVNNGAFTSENANALGNAKGTVTINDGSFTGGTGYASVENQATMVIKAGTFDRGQKNGPAITNYGSEADLTIIGGTFSGWCPDNVSNKVTCAAIQIRDNAKINVQGGTFTGMDGAIYCLPALVEGTKFISGGTFNSNVNQYVVEGSQAKEADGKWTIVPAEGSVAVIGNVGYSTLQAAIAAAQDGDTVKLLTNVTTDTELTVKPGVTLDGGGNTLTNSAGRVLSATGATVKNLTIEANGNGYAIYTNGDTTVENCTFNGTTTWQPIYVRDDGAPGVVVTGCTFNTSRSMVIRSNAKFTNNVLNGAKGLTISDNVDGAVVTGNTFNNARLDIYPIDNTKVTIEKNKLMGTSYVELEPGKTYTEPVKLNGNYWPNYEVSAKESWDTADNRKVVITTCYDSEAMTSLVVGPDAVAEVGGEYFETLQAAITAATEGQTVELLKSTAESVTIAQGQNITLNIPAGVTLKNSESAQDNTVPDAQRKHTITNKGTLTITGEGTVDNVSHGRAAVYNDGTITLAGGTYTRSEEKGHYDETAGSRVNGGNSWYVVRNNAGTMTIADGATVKGTSGFSSMVSNGSNNNGAVLNITGGTLESTSYVAIQNQIGCTLNISGGKVEGTGAPYCLSLYGTTNISGTAEVNGWVQVWSYDFYAARREDNEHPVHIRSELNISGGTLNDTQLQAVHGLSGYDPALSASELDLAKNYALWGTGDTKSLINITGGTINMQNGLMTCRITNDGGTGRGIEETDNGGAAEILVSGGTFSTAVDSKYCAENFLPVANENGTYGVTGGTLGISASSSSLSGGGTVTLTVTPANLTANVEVTCDNGITVNKTNNTTFTAALPNTTRDYIFTVTAGGKTNTCGVSVTRYTSGGGGSTGGGTTTRPTQPEENIDEPDVPLAQPLPFTDVAENDWFYEAVYFVYDRDMMKGTDDGTVFQPAMTTTRGMIVTILHRLEGEPEAAASTFSDVAAGAWYTDAVNWAAANGIVKGFEDGSFRPEVTITRQEMAAILSRYAAFKGYDKSAVGDMSLYNDKTLIGDWAVEDVTWAVGAKVLSGKGNNLLDPVGTTSRAEAAQMLKNFCEAFAAADEK